MLVKMDQKVQHVWLARKTMGGGQKLLISWDIPDLEFVWWYCQAQFQFTASQVELRLVILSLSVPPTNPPGEIYLSQF